MNAAPMSAPLPEDPLAAMLAGGAPPVDPAMDPAMAGMPMDPMMDPAMAGMVPPPAPAGFPSADPAMVGSLLEQLLMAQQMDHQSLQQQQVQALVGNPLFEAMVSGAPLTPGAGQDAQAIAPTGDIPPSAAGLGLA